MIAVSIVSHGHGAMVDRLLGQLIECPEISRIVVTQNIPEQSVMFQEDRRIEAVCNSNPKGFGSNHNSAFKICCEPYFCILNPDIELVGNPFAILVGELGRQRAAVIAPLVVSPQGIIEDSVRYFPTLSSLFVKLFFGSDGRYPIEAGQKSFLPEWCAGMFLLFRRDEFARLNGFDERYFLYYEDVDICVRVWQQGMRVVACPEVSVVHDARRDSRRSLKHLRWHLASMMRFFWQHWGRLPSVPGGQGLE